jgi:hypothetical protein
MAYERGNNQGDAQIPEDVFEIPVCQYHSEYQQQHYTQQYDRYYGQQYRNPAYIAERN